MTYKFSFLLVAVSVIIKLIAIHFTKFDLFGDEAQYWIWSKNIDLGYYSKPPLLSWLINIYTFIFGNSFEALKYFSLFFYFFTSYVVYLLAYELYQKKKIATLAALSFYLLPSVSVSSFLISTDVVLVFLGSLFLLVLLKIRKKPLTVNFIILGILLGLSFLTKYAVIYYVFSLILIIYFDTNLRSVFLNKKLNLFLFFISFVVVISPNIMWNIQNGWVTLAHTSDNVGLDRISFNIIQGFEFLISQAFMLGPILFFTFLILFKKIKFNFQTKFLLFFSLPVFVIVFVESVMVRANANWAAIGLIPLFMLATSTTYEHFPKTIFYNNLFNFSFCFVLFSLIATSSNLSVFDRINGISNFSNKIESEYLKENKFLVIQDRLLYSSLFYSLRNSSKILLTPYNPKNKVKSHFHLSNPLAPEHDKNFIFIGNLESLNYLKKEYSAIKRIEFDVKFVGNRVEVYEVFF